MKRLSYYDPRRALWLLYVAATIAVALYSSAAIFIDSYSKAEAHARQGVYVSDEIYYVDSSRRYLQDVFQVNISYWEYSGRTDDDYYNLEHPPLGKYIIGLSMMICGDRPLCWRLPGIVEASLIPLILYVAYATLPGGAAPLAGAIAALAVASDPIIRNSGSIAMLDIHLAFFTALSLALAVRSRWLLSSISAGLALAVKISGAGTVLGLILSLYRVRSVRSRVFHAAAVSLAAASVFAASHIPILGYFGFERLVDETINAIIWHTSPRPPGGPPTSNPIQWIFNANPFVFSYGEAPMRAVVNTVIHLVALYLAVFSVVAVLASPSRAPRFAAPLFYAGIMLGYFSAFAAGNTTLYSFYAVQLSPVAAGVLAELALYIWNGAGIVGGSAPHNSPAGPEGPRLEG